MECVNKQTAFKLMCPQDAFMLGNIDQDLYCPYKGFSNYPILAKTPKGQLLGEVMMYDFYVHEMNLYLDTHPCNQEILEKMIMFQNKANVARKNYEQQFGPLTVSHLTPCHGYQWICGPWPWQKQ